MTRPFAIIAAIALSASLAAAGKTRTIAVGFSTWGPYEVADGTLADTRAAVPIDAELGCTLYAVAGWTTAECTACSGGHCLYCSTYDPALVDAVRAIGDDSELLFAVDTTHSPGQCYQIMASHSSALAPRR